MKKILAMILFFVVLTVVTPRAYAAFGAGTTKGWPNTQDGATATVVSPLYKTPPAAYTAGEQITIVFRVKNPENNTHTITHNLYVNLWKVEKADPEKQTSTEDQLNQNHQSQNDTQSLYKILSIGQLSLTPGDTSEFNATFTIDAPGYYQFDLTDLTNASYAPGHIYAAGFLRVKGAGERTVLSAQTSRTAEGSSIWGKILLFSLLGLVLGMLFFIMKKRRDSQRNAPLFSQ